MNDNLQMNTETQVTIRIHSIHGDNRVVETIDNAMGILKEQVEKFGKWIYVGKRRFRLDPHSAVSMNQLREAITATPQVQVTGSLRGGRPDFTAMTLKELKAEAKAAKIKGASKLSKQQLIDALALSNSGRGSNGAKSDGPVLELSDEGFKRLRKGEKMVMAVVQKGNTIVLHPSVAMRNYQNQIASLMLAEING